MPATVEVEDAAVPERGHAAWIDAVIAEFDEAAEHDRPVETAIVAVTDEDDEAVLDRGHDAVRAPVTVLLDEADVQESAAAVEIVAATVEVLLTDPLRASDAPAASSSRRSQCT